MRYLWSNRYVEPDQIECGQGFQIDYQIGDAPMTPNNNVALFFFYFMQNYGVLIAAS